MIRMKVGVLLAFGTRREDMISLGLIWDAPHIPRAGDVLNWTDGPDGLVVAWVSHHVDTGEIVVVTKQKSYIDTPNLKWNITPEIREAMLARYAKVGFRPWSEIEEAGR